MAHFSPELLAQFTPEQVAQFDPDYSLTDELSLRTKFNVKYIKKIHKLALGHLYSFAGKYRTVNMSKGGFLFPAAQFIYENMDVFEDEILSRLPRFKF